MIEGLKLTVSGVFNNGVAKRGDRYTPEDSFFLMADGRRYYTAEFQKTFRAKVAKLNAPILIVQGDVGERPIDLDGPSRNRFNADVLIPELRATGKQVEVKVPRPGSLLLFRERAAATGRHGSSGIVA